MEYCGDQNTTALVHVSSSSIPFSSLPSTSSFSPTQTPPPPPPRVIMSPCAACRNLRRRCVEKCILAPYFPPTDPLKFIVAHKVFGASNIIKLLQELPESQREDAVNSMVYEANARIRNPVHGCAGIIYQLQNQVTELQAELAKTQASNMPYQQQQQPHEKPPYDNSRFSFDDCSFSPAWEPLWR